MTTRKRERTMTIRLSDMEYDSICEKAKLCGQSKTEFIINRALSVQRNDDNRDDNSCANAATSDAEKCAWNHFNVDHLQSLRRITIVIRMLRFMLSRQMNIPETEVNVLMQQFIEAVQVDFPDRLNIFAR